MNVPFIMQWTDEIRELITDAHSPARKFSLVRVSLDQLRQQLACSSEDEWTALYLTGEEQQQYYRFRYEKRKMEWLGGRIAAKAAAGSLLQPNGFDHWLGLAIQPNKHGRPSLVTNTSFACSAPPAVSISHSRLFAVGLAAPFVCGVDLQEMTEAVCRVRHRFCTAEERAILKQVPISRIPDTMAGLTLLWSAKEAIKKKCDLVPLLYFSEIHLQSIRQSGLDGLRMDFFCERPEKLKIRYSVLAVCCNRYALAISLHQPPTEQPPYSLSYMK